MKRRLTIPIQIPVQIAVQLILRLTIFSWIFLSPFLMFSQPVMDIRNLATSGDVPAMLKLAEKFDTGIGLQMNSDSAKYWIAKAANTGNADAQYLLGLRFTAFIFSKNEFDSGMSWLKKAADQGHIEAMLKLNEIHNDRGTGEGTATQSSRYYSKEMAFQYARKAAESGDEEGALRTGRAYFNGSGVIRNDSLAEKWMRIAAVEKKYPPAMCELADLLLEGYNNHEPNPFAASKLYDECHRHPKSGIQLRVLADIGLQECSQMMKQIHNMMMQSCPLLAPGTFQYR